MLPPEMLVHEGHEVRVSQQEVITYPAELVDGVLRVAYGSGDLVEVTDGTLICDSCGIEFGAGFGDGFEQSDLVPI